MAPWLRASDAPRLGMDSSLRVHPARDQRLQSLADGSVDVEEAGPGEAAAVRLQGCVGAEPDPLAVGQAMERDAQIGVDEGNEADRVEDGAHPAAGVSHDEETLGGR